jgi:hypothetical protein
VNRLRVVFRDNVRLYEAYPTLSLDDIMKALTELGANQFEGAAFLSTP